VDTPHVLYTLALQADNRLTEVLTARTGRTRWTLKAEDYHIPEVREALMAKHEADEAWLAYMHWDSQQRTAARGSK
jgi:hypothetical protein